MTLCNLCTKLDFSRLAYRQKREIVFTITSAIDQKSNGHTGIDHIPEDFGGSDQTEGSGDEEGDGKSNRLRILEESNQKTGLDDFGDEYESVDSKAAEGEHNFGGDYRYDRPC